MNPSMIRQWLRGGEIDQLEQVVLEGQGHKLIGEYSPDPKVRNFLKTIPNYLVSAGGSGRRGDSCLVCGLFQAKIAELHDAVSRGDLNKLKSAMPSGDHAMKNVSLCKDLTGTGLLHKAVYNGFSHIVQVRASRAPSTANTASHAVNISPVAYRQISGNGKTEGQRRKDCTPLLWCFRK